MRSLKLHNPTVEGRQARASNLLLLFVSFCFVFLNQESTRLMPSNLLPITPSWRVKTPLNSEDSCKP